MSGNKSKNKLKVEVRTSPTDVEVASPGKLETGYIRKRGFQVIKEELIVWDGDVRLKARTDEVDPSDAGVALWNETLELSHITSHRPKIDIFVVRKTSVGKAKNLSGGHLDTKILDPAGIERRSNRETMLANEGVGGAGDYGRRTSTSIWREIMKAIFESKQRGIAQKMLERALAEAGRYFVNFVEEIRVEDAKENKNKNGGGGGGGSVDKEGGAADSQLSWARRRLKKIEKFLKGVQSRFESHPKFFKNKTSALVEGPANAVIVNSCMRIFEAFTSMQQKDFKLVLGVLSLFIRLWPKYGGKVAKELTVMKLPIIRHFCLNCEKSLRLVIERVFCQISLEAPILRENGRFETNGPRDLFTVLRSHVGGLLPHIEGVAVLELAQFEQGLIAYFQSLFRHKLRCVHFNKHDSAVERRGGDSKFDSGNGSSGGKKKKMKARAFWSSRRFSAHMISHGPHDVGGISLVKDDACSPVAGLHHVSEGKKGGEAGTKPELNEEYVIAVIASCRHYTECLEQLFDDMKVRLLRNQESQRSEMALNLRGMQEKLSAGFDAIARAACGVLADYWVRELKQDCFGALFTKKWQQHAKENDGQQQQQQHPCGQIVRWWQEAIADVETAISWERGIGYLSSALIYSSIDAYTRHLAYMSPKLQQSDIMTTVTSGFLSLLKDRGGGGSGNSRATAGAGRGGNEYDPSSSKVLMALFEDVNWMRQQVSKRAGDLGVLDKREAMGAFVVLEIVGEFLSVKDSSPFEADVTFSRLIDRLGVFARVVVKGLVRMHSDWSKLTKTEVMGRFSQYEQALGAFGSNPLVPDVGDSRQTSPALERIRDMARLCDCLRHLDVMSTAGGTILGRPAIMVAKKNQRTPWYGLTLLFYTDEKTKRVSALKAGRALTASGIDERVVSEMEKFEVMINSRNTGGTTQGSGGEDGTGNKIAPEDVLDVVTLEDFLS
eukprot:jgi/Bigna1/80640/fgenesh1_pg.73_\